MKNFTLVLFVTVLMTLTGCAALDSFFFEPMRDAEGNEQWIDVEATKALPKEMRDADKVVLVDSNERIPGREYEQAYSDEPSEAFGAVGQLAGGAGSMLGGWGALIGPLFGGLFGGYALIRGKRKVSAANVGKKAAVMGAAEIAQVLKDWQEGKIDTDKNGEISFAEVKAYLAKTGRERFAKPEFVQSVLSIIDSSMSKSEQQAALEKAAENL